MVSLKPSPAPLGSATTAAHTPCSLPTVTDGLPSTPPGEAFPPHPFVSSTLQSRKQLIIPAPLPWDFPDRKDLCYSPSSQGRACYLREAPLPALTWSLDAEYDSVARLVSSVAEACISHAREGLRTPTLALLLHPPQPFTAPRASCA